MPELAEVETLRRYLQQNILGAQIKEYRQFRDKIRYPIAENIASHIEGSTIVNARRRAKYLLLELSNNNCLIFHLGMTGRITCQPIEYKAKKHDHVIITLQSGQLVFNDTRRFGMIYCCKKDSINTLDFIRNLGPEPLTSFFDSNYLENQLVKRKMPIKTAIMCNEIVVGVGNIYASESLFRAKINPLRPACSLKRYESENLVIAIKEVLQDAIEAGGTTLRDFVNGDSNPGYFSQELNVYNRAEQLCKSCSHEIHSVRQSGRTTFYCPICQKL